jgi:hypothetical protein
MLLFLYLNHKEVKKMSEEDFIPSEAEREHVKQLTVDAIQNIHQTLWNTFEAKMKIVPVGSTVKGTFISGDHDIDIYIVTEDPELALTIIKGDAQFQNGVLLQSGTLKVWRINTTQADFDLVFSKPSDLKVDTMEHARFFNAELSRRQKDDVIRLKVLFKSHGLYGAERGGITGVALEEVIRQSGSLGCAMYNLTGTWILQDPVLKHPRNLLASIIPIRKTKIVSLLNKFTHQTEFGGKEFILAHKRIYTLTEFENDWLAEHKDGYFLSFKRKGEAHVDFTEFLGAANSVLRELKSLEDVEGEADVFVDDIRVIVAVAGLPSELTPFKAKFMFTVGRKQEEIDAFKEKHAVNGWIQHDEDNLMAIVERKIRDPMRHFATNLKAKINAEE